MSEPGSFIALRIANLAEWCMKAYEAGFGQAAVLFEDETGAIYRPEKGGEIMVDDDTPDAAPVAFILMRRIADSRDDVATVKVPLE